MIAARSDLAASHFVPYVATRSRRAWNRLDVGLAVLLFFLSLALYTKTLAPTINAVSFDSPELATKSAQIRMAHMPGSPVYVWMGHLFTRLPFGEIATRVNWMSAVMGAISIGLLYLLIVRHVTGHRLSALGGAVLFALSVTFWSQAVTAEVYTPNMAFTAVTMLALLEWASLRDGAVRRAWEGRLWLIVAAAAFGLSLGIHLSNVLFLSAFALFALLGWPIRRDGRVDHPGDVQVPRQHRFDVVAGALAVSAALLMFIVPYTWVYFVLPFVPPGDGFPNAEPGWPAFYASTFNAFSDWRFAYPLAQIPDRVVVFLRLLFFNLGPVGIGLMLVGFVQMLWTRLRLFYLLVPLALANVIFYINYKAPDIDVFFIPTYWVAVALIAMGLDAIAVAVRSLVYSLQERRIGAIAARRSQASLGITARSEYMAEPVKWLPVAAMLILLLLAAQWNWKTSYPHNDRSQDFSFRDFYGNLFTALPQGAYYYHRGAAMGYDLLYYTDAYHVRPDLHIQAGPLENEPPVTYWPPGPVFSGTTKHDIFLPAFLEDKNKWYDQWMFGMFNWKSNILWGWLKSYKVRRDLPQEWMVRADSPDAPQPSHVVNHHFTSLLTLIGYDAEPQAQRGRPWRFVRYWRTTLEHIPPIATVLGDYQFVEIHSPLSDQLTDYIAAREIKKENLGEYIVRDEMYLIIPSNLPLGRYNISMSPINRSIGSLMYEPADAPSLVPREKQIMTLEVTEAPPLDPLNLPTGEGEK